MLESSLKGYVMICKFLYDLMKKENLHGLKYTSCRKYETKKWKLFSFKKNRKWSRCEKRKT